MKHSTFEITFYPNESDLKREAADKTLPARYQVTVVYRPWDNLSATVESGQFEYTPAELEMLAGKAVRYGQYLGEKLFCDPVAGLFQTALAGNQDSLHCLLQLESKSLRGIRWERLRGPLARGPNGWNYLGMTSRTPLTVHVAGGVRRRFPPRGFSAFRSLLVVASPNRAWDAPAFDVPDTVSEVKAGMDDNVVTVLARTDDAKGKKPTLAELLKQLTQNSFTALHVVAHCASQAPTGFYLILEDDDGNADRVPVSTLISELAKLRDDQLPYLTFLECCSSAAWDDDDAEMTQSIQNCLYQGAFAQTLVREAGLPAVVGMVDLITPETAGKLAKVFYQQLRKHGRPDVALAEARAGLGDERDILAPLLISQLGALPMFDRAIDTVPTDPDVIANGLKVLEKALEQRAPILLEKGDEGGIAAKRYHVAVAAIEPPRRDDPVWQSALEDLNSIAEECLSSATGKASFSGICARQAIPDYDPNCPFKGMKPIDFDSRRYFKAREKLTSELVALLRADEVLVVVGPSGSGKSSLMLAGVLPLLGLRDNKDFGLCAPGPDPLGALDKALAAPMSPAAPLVVDQFEELFTHSMLEETRCDFLVRLQAEKARRRILITLRSEFRDRLRNTWLWPFVPDPEDKTKTRLGAAEVAAMSTEDLGRAILEQAAEAGLQFDEGLIDEIREAIDGEPGRMPLLQHTLLELWNRRHGTHLRRQEYTALGGVRQAVSRTADTFVDKVLTIEDDRRRVKDLFSRLVRVADESDITNQTRRRTHIAELVPAGERPGKTQELLEELKKRYLVITAGAEAEVAHEALIQHWDTLGQWVKKYHGDLRVRQTLAVDSSDWERRGRPTDGLVHRGEKLLDAKRRLLKHSELRLNQTEVDYLDACERQQRWEVWFRNGLISVTLVLIVGVIGALWYAERQDFQRQITEANAAKEKTEQEAKHQLAIADAEKKRAVEQERADRLTDEAESRAERQLVEEGTRQMDSYDQLGALPYFAEALRVRENQPERQTAHRQRLGAVLATSPASMLRLEHEKLITSAEYSPDGRFILTGSHDGTAQVWDARTGGRVGKTLRHVGDKNARLPHLGMALVLLVDDMPMELPKGRKLRPAPPLRDPDGRIEWAGFSSNSRHIMTVSDDPKHWCRVWETETGNPITDYLPPPGSEDATGPTYGTVCFHPEGGFVVLATKNRVQVWDIEAKKAVWEKPAEAPGTVQLLRCLPNSVVVAGCKDGSLALIGGKNGTEVRTIPFTSAVMAAEFSRDYRYLFASGTDSSDWRLADLQGNTEKRLSVRGKVLGGRFSPDGRRLAVLASDGTVRIFDTKTVEALANPIVCPAQPRDVSFSPDGHWIAVVCNGEARIWDAEFAREFGPTFPGFEKQVAFSPDGMSLLSPNGPAVTVWGLVPASSMIRIELPGSPARVAFSADGRWQATCRGSPGAWHVEVRDRREQRSVEVPGPIRHSGSLLGMVGGDTWRAVTALATQRPLGLPFVSKGREPVELALSADGRRLVTYDGRDCQVWDLTTGNLICRLEGDLFMPATLAFSRDGSRVAACATLIGHPTVWDAATGRRRAIIPVSPEREPIPRADKDLPDYATWHVEFGPDARSLLTVSSKMGDDPSGRFWAGGFARLWDVETRVPLSPAIRFDSDVRQAALSFDGKRIVTAGSGRDSEGKRIANPGAKMVAAVWDVTTGKALTPPMLMAGIEYTAFSSDANGRYIITGGDLGMGSLGAVRIWDAASGQPITPVLRVDRPVTWAAFDPGSGRMLLASSSRISSARVPSGATAWEILLPSTHQRIPEVLADTRIRALRWIDNLGGLIPIDPAENRPKGHSSASPPVEQVVAWHQEEAAELQAQNRHEGASWHLERMARLRPRPEVFVQLGVAQAKSQQWVAALHSLEKADPRVAGSVELLKQRGDVAAQLALWDKAASDFKAALTLLPPGKAELGEPEVDLRARIAQVAVAQGDNEGYGTQCRVLADKVDEDTSSRLLIAVSEVWSLRPDSGPPPRQLIDAVQTNCRIFSDDLEGRAALASLYFRSGKFADAEAEFKRLPERLPGATKLIRILSLARVDLAAAQKEFEDVQKTIEDMVPAKGNLSDNPIVWTDRVQILALRDEVSRVLDRLKRKE